MIILDTNVLSEPTRPSPSPAVRQWIVAQRRETLFTTAITEAEMLWGVELMPAGRRRETLMEQVRRIFHVDLAERVLPFDSRAAREYPAVALARRKAGIPISAADAQIAAIARVHGAVVATHNSADFKGCGVEVVDPWSASS